jgi:hypothetical protein
MMRLLVFLSCVGAAIYALLVVTNNKMPVVPDGTKAELLLAKLASGYGVLLFLPGPLGGWQPRHSSVHLSKRSP